MTTYIVTEKATNTEVYRYASEAPIAWSGMEFLTHAHIPLVEEVQATPQGPRRLTKLAFIDFFDGDGTQTKTRTLAYSAGVLSSVTEG